jgi:hypothetical protein
MTLEFELWSHASRHPELRAHLTRRYRGAWRGIVGAAGGVRLDAESAGSDADTDNQLGPAVIGLLFGLEMMRRIDPDRVTDDLAVRALRGVVDACATEPGSLETR